MAEESKTEVQQTQGGDGGQTEVTDWKAKYEEMRAHSREWEKKAKANQSSADELEKIKAEQMSELEKAQAAAKAANDELATLKAEKALNDAAKKIAEDTGVPLELLLYCKDEDSMTEFAEKYAKQDNGGDVSTIPSARGNKKIIHSGNNSEKRTNGDVFAEVAAQLFN